MADTITICRNHPEYQVPLLTTFKWSNYEHWCPFCGAKYEMFNNCEDKPATQELMIRLALYSAASRQYLMGNTNDYALNTKVEAEGLDTKSSS
jgi:hypothetical protein